MMATLFSSIFIGIILIVFVWLMIPSSEGSNTGIGSENEFIDPDNAYQLGMLMGMHGGDIGDAALLRYALQRFESIHGRKATMRDIGIVIGLIRS